MPGNLYSSTELDSDGRQFVLSDNILHVRYYDNSLEVWDKNGAGNQSWYNEIFSPNDTFGAVNINTDRWNLIGPTRRTLEQADGDLLLGLERAEGKVSLSSEGKWRLSGDIDIRLYIDWDSYYNEYRSITHTFLKVGYDNSNAVRTSFVFDGVSGFKFSSEITDGRDIRYLDWRDNGSPEILDLFTDAFQWTYFRITREGSTVKTFISNGVTELQIGADVTEAAFTNDLYVEFGLESKEYNTYRQNFTKFFVAKGTVSPTTKFFSTDRGTGKGFPPHLIAVVDSGSVSLIDEDAAKMWLRILIGPNELIPDSSVRIAANNGTVYLTTPDGLVALDFVQDKIFKYRGSEIQVADEPIALRNAGVTFRTFAANAGTMPDNNIHGVDCRKIGSEYYIALTHDAGITVRRALASGVSNCSDGPVPGQLTTISDRGALYWTGNDVTTDVGQLSYYSNVAALAIAGTNTFSRAGYYGTDSTLPIMGENITCFGVRTVTDTDFLAVGTTEGLTFISLIPAVPTSKSETYGVDTNTVNPFSDPTFTHDVGVDWIPFHNGYIRNNNIYNTQDWVTSSSWSLLLRANDLQTGANIIVGTKFGVYQDVDLTGVERIYFDLNFCPEGTGTNVWEFQIVVGDTVVKSYNSAEGPFIKFTDSADVLSFFGIQRVQLRIYYPVETPGDRFPMGLTTLGDHYVYITNFRSAVGNPAYRVLPAGNSSIKEVLLQYDDEGHKLYFATAEGFGAIDLNHHSLDYFTPLAELVVDPTTENLSADFARIEDET